MAIAEVPSHEEPKGAPPRLDPTVRLWPVWTIVALQLITFALSVTPAISNPDRFSYMMLGPLGCTLLFLGWMLFLSKLRWSERCLSLAAFAVPAIVAGFLIDSSVGIAMFIYGAPLGITIVATVMTVGRRWERRQRQAVLIPALIICWSVFPLLRLDGFQGNYLPEFSFRFSPTSEEQLALASAAAVPAAGQDWTPAAVEWPGFRGPSGNSTAQEIKVAEDWRDQQPALEWKIPIGPGWSSFAFVSGRLFTQEQRGEDELVTCLDAATGARIWEHADKSRFTDVVAGAGPRATPTYSEGRLFTYGARALLNCLDAETGKLLWQRDLVADYNAQLPVWGFSNSPLVRRGLVVVYAGGDSDHGLMAFSADNGELVWELASRGMNFSSATVVELQGQTCGLFADGRGVFGFELSTGEVLWTFKPQDWAGPVMCQPQVIEESSILTQLGDGVGVARLDVTSVDGNWSVSERWSSKVLRPSFNDFVYHQGSVYGFNQNIFACIDADTGRKQWKRGRYGFGQVVLLPSVSQLIVTTESGDAVLLQATPDKSQEVGRVPTVDGKTWNHPIIANGRLFVRNGEFAVCLNLNQSPK